jgi:hypothetical protein
VRDVYFRMARRAFGACRNLPDLEISAGVPPILSVLDALELRDPVASDVPLDSRPESGLPFYDKIASVVIDLDRIAGRTDAGEVAAAELRRAEAVERALDEIILDKRRPSPVVARDLAKVGYETFLSRRPSLHTGMASPIQMMALGDSEVPEPGLFSWSYWDTTSSRPVRCYAKFESDTGPVTEFVDGMGRISRQYDALSFPLVAIAAAIDGMFPSAGIKRVTRIVYGPMLTPLFMSPEGHPFLEAMASSGVEQDDLWSLGVRREEIVHSGTTAPGGFFGMRRHRVFDVDASDPECDAAGATSITRTLLVPYHLCQRVVDDPALGEFLSRRRVKSVREDGTILK